MLYRASNAHRRALNCRCGCYFVLIQSNQKSSQQRGFFTLVALPCKAVRTTGCKKLLHFVRSFPSLRQIFAMPLQPHEATMFCLLSSEAYLLTGEKISLLNLRSFKNFVSLYLHSMRRGERNPIQTKKDHPLSDGLFFMLSHTFQWAGRLSNFDFHFNSTWQFKFHQGIYSF
ncbi:hypothetical protein M2273_005068 [Mucilaginibacter lappiensis]